jgi:hypothetical protein
MQWQSIILTSIGSGIVSVVVVLLKQFYDRKIEVQKSKLGRASWVHQRQVDALARLYLSLHNMRDDLQGATRLSRLANEVNPEEYMKRFYQDSSSAWSEFVANKLLLANDVVLKCSELFEEFQNAQITLGSAKIVNDGAVRLDLSREAQKIAHERIPALLQEIERSARKIIHEETEPN